VPAEQVCAPASGHVDVAIVGAGPVGAALACGLQDLGLEAVVLEARVRLEGPDPRAIALSEGSRLILQRLGVWDELGPHATPIESIHVSQRGSFGRAELTARDMAVPALGYVAQYGDLHGSLVRRMRACDARVLTGARVMAAGATTAYGMVRFLREGKEELLTARLVVLSEGGKGLPAAQRQDKDYGQAALVCTVTTSRPHDHKAYERFTPEGPIALLPLGGAYALIWTTPAQQVEARLALDDREFLQQLQAAFGDRQGRFLRAGPRAAFPLRLSLTHARHSPRLLRIGNAAHVLHPVAGQGFNLGLRDAWRLAEALADLPRERLGMVDMREYDHRRRADILGGSIMTDLLVTGFSNDWPILRQFRGLALAALDLASPLKTLFTRKMMFGARTW